MSKFLPPPNSSHPPFCRFWPRQNVTKMSFGHARSAGRREWVRWVTPSPSAIPTVDSCELMEPAFVTKQLVLALSSHVSVWASDLRAAPDSWRVPSHTDEPAARVRVSVRQNCGKTPRLQLQYMVILGVSSGSNFSYRHAVPTFYHDIPYFNVILIAFSKAAQWQCY